MHLAQLNIAEAIASMESPIMADFINNTDRINALAEKHPGFIWRLKGEETDHSYSIQAFDNEALLVNMSVWKDRESLFDYVYNSGHIEILSGAKNGSVLCQKCIWSCGILKKVIFQRSPRPKND